MKKIILIIIAISIYSELFAQTQQIDAKNKLNKYEFTFKQDVDATTGHSCVYLEDYFSTGRCVVCIKLPPNIQRGQALKNSPITKDWKTVIGVGSPSTTYAKKAVADVDVSCTSNLKEEQILKLLKKIMKYENKSLETGLKHLENFNSKYPSIECDV